MCDVYMYGYLWLGGILGKFEGPPQVKQNPSPKYLIPNGYIPAMCLDTTIAMVTTIATGTAPLVYSSLKSSGCTARGLVPRPLCVVRFSFQTVTFR